MLEGVDDVQNVNIPSRTNAIACPGRARLPIPFLAWRLHTSDVNIIIFVVSLPFCGAVVLTGRHDGAVIASFAPRALHDRHV